MAQYPTAAGTDANLYVSVNSKTTVLAGALTASGGNNGADIEVTSTSGFPAAGFITIDSEAIAYTSLLSGPPRFSGITRGADGTTAATHNDLSLVRHEVIAAHHNVLKDEVKAVEDDLVAAHGSLNESDTPAATATDVKDRLDQIVTQIKAIHGRTNWYTTPIRPYNSLFNYRRPQLIWTSVTTVDISVAIPASPNRAVVIFPDGERREEGVTRQFIITQNAVLTTSGKQTGLRTSLSEATNTWYAIYAVKCSDGPGFVLVGDTTLPSHATISTLDGFYGTDSWVYLGMIRNGDNAGATGDILDFVQSGSFTLLRNLCSPSAFNTVGLKLATSASTASLTYTVTNGIGTTDIPNHIENQLYQVAATGGTGNHNVRNSAGTKMMHSVIGTGNLSARVWCANDGINISSGSAVAMDILLAGWNDPVLGVGANPQV